MNQNLVAMLKTKTTWIAVVKWVCAVGISVGWLAPNIPDEATKTVGLLYDAIAQLIALYMVLSGASDIAKRHTAIKMESRLDEIKSE